MLYFILRYLPLYALIYQAFSLTLIKFYDKSSAYITYRKIVRRKLIFYPKAYTLWTSTNPNKHWMRKL